MQRSAAGICLALPWSIAELAELVEATLARNNFANASVRIIVTGGPAVDFMTPGENPSLLILVTPLVNYAPHLYTSGATLATTVAVRERPAVKSLAYIGAIMAMKEAAQQGAVEALYRTKDGFVTECTRSNFFVFEGDTLITPQDDVLDGITRRVVLDLAKEQFDVQLRPLPYADLAAVDETFITSSTKEVLPVVEIDGVTIGGGVPGRRTRELMTRFTAYARSFAGSN